MGYEHDTRVLEGLALLRVYGYGLCMGTADALPGVSGGTVALLLGFYGRLLAAITALTPARVGAVFRGVKPAYRKTARESLLEMDLRFLLPLGAGMVTAVAVIASAVSALASSHPVALASFFSGLIGASAIVLYRSVSIATRGAVLAMVAGISLALLVGANVIQFPVTGLWMVFVAGVVAISAMILPGISGSLLLILLGQYVYLSGELSAFLSGLAALPSGGSLETLVSPGTTVIVFMTGGVVGLLTVARVVRRALDWQRNLTLVFLVSLIAGSTPAPLINIVEGQAWSTEAILIGTGWLVVGAGVLFGLNALAGGFDPE
ncbi:DUF368 domain-containing protein [Halobacteria archaeon AArc-curdl1]|uniref:DUF368 domain-containing protein n=1 Tax=Natronosalvus hydrolyticus TaxID=2979988 RepID=A0AAP3E6K6_9EURY|nr:DUF368 domain-containing protein [Halobacteria archaeon AArc-curdl1]